MVPDHCIAAPTLLATLTSQRSDLLALPPERPLDSLQHVRLDDGRLVLGILGLAAEDAGRVEQNGLPSERVGAGDVGLGVVACEVEERVRITRSASERHGRSGRRWAN